MVHLVLLGGGKVLGSMGLYKGGGSLWKIRMTKFEIRINDEIPMTKREGAVLRGLLERSEEGMRGSWVRFVKKYVGFERARAVILKGGGVGGFACGLWWLCFLG